MKNCKVISTYFGPRRSFPYGKKFTMELINEIFNTELTINPGVNLDVLLVNHDYGDEESKNFLENFNNKKIINGIFKVINRPWEDGIGGSFKSFSYAFENFKDYYDNWFFTEDDAIIIAENYYKKSIEQLNNYEKVAFIGFNRGEVERNIPLHCHSGCGFTNKKYLNLIYDNIGSLPFSKEKMPNQVQEYIKSENRDAFLNSDLLKNWYRKFELEGEVAFTNEFVKMGYKIVEFESNHPIIKLYNSEIPVLK